MTGRVVIDGYGSVAGFVRAARGNLTLSRRPAGTVPAEPCPAASLIDGPSPPPGASAPVIRAACAPPPVRKRVEVAEP
jgi:hypothetical protein